jgi:hypothetical protein
MAFGAIQSRNYSFFRKVALEAKDRIAEQDVFAVFLAFWGWCNIDPVSQAGSDLPAGVLDRIRSARYVWSKSWRTILFALLTAVGFSAIAAGIFKAVPGYFGIAICQVAGERSALMGAFHGISAAVLWGGGITAVVLTMMVTCGENPVRLNYKRRVGLIVAGALSGLVFGTAIVFVILGVYSLESIQGIGWISMQHERFSHSFFEEIFLQSRLGLVYPITGAALGVAFALAYIAVFKNREIASTLPFFEAVNIERPFYGTAFLIASGQFFRLIVPVSVGVFVSALVVDSSFAVHKFPRGFVDVLIHAAADSLTQVVGAVACIFGCICGLFVAKVGVSEDKIEEIN